ncbi:hypothetical protein THASP1DRAFT_30214 [Thamnocephalis sphaerospora]|uniref:Uncharacterized protein n=1 Tax=Thamnocephalis sphaerospora TaxID=78915 RepID=A0A4P9XPP7_9FUNG|nr:hypothetical protein THASP1DRAFT_30214 [Thamnocephalis sphaerospora]|eukprot:RKP07976.1 hypothetical protein THASP1DRAFT_30214 [Thamnocephalis sphaerospora]
MSPPNLALPREEQHALGHRDQQRVFSILLSATIFGAVFFRNAEVSLRLYSAHNTLATKFGCVQSVFFLLGILVYLLRYVVPLSTDIDPDHSFHVCAISLNIVVLLFAVGNIAAYCNLWLKAYYARNRARRMLGVGCLLLCVMIAFTVDIEVLAEVRYEPVTRRCMIEFSERQLYLRVALDVLANTYLTGSFLWVVWQMARRANGVSYLRSIAKEGLIYMLSATAINIFIGIGMLTNIIPRHDVMAYGLEQVIVNTLLTQQLQSTAAKSSRVRLHSNTSSDDKKISHEDDSRPELLRTRFEAERLDVDGRHARSDVCFEEWTTLTVDAMYASQVSRQQRTENDESSVLHDGIAAQDSRHYRSQCRATSGQDNMTIAAGEEIASEPALQPVSSSW